MPGLQRGPGPVALLGSGEISASGGVLYDELARRMSLRRVAVLETPAGFQPNAERVAGKVADFLRVRLQNIRPTVETVPARRRGTPASPDSPEVAAMLVGADMIFLGPGSPTYAARQLEGSLVWRALLERHAAGAAVVASSAAVIALGRMALPVYEIYKVGEELHWQPGLGLLGRYGLRLALVPHWNNAEGGAELDTSRCFMGRARWDTLAGMLPPDVTVVGIDEHTALVLDVAVGACRVLGRGAATVIRDGEERVLGRGESLGLDALGPFEPPAPGEEEPEPQPAAGDGGPPAEVHALVERRQQARAGKDWAGADMLRREIAALGWQVKDTPDGPVVMRG